MVVSTVFTPRIGTHSSWTQPTKSPIEDALNRTAVGETSSQNTPVW